jgi:hypothetical protein
MQTNGLTLPDIFGNEVRVGDTVACIVPWYSWLTKCTVLKVTPKGFTVEYHDGARVRTTNRDRCNVVKKL